MQHSTHTTHRRRLPLWLGTALALSVASIGLAQAALTLQPGDGAITVEGQAGGDTHATRYGITDDGVCTGWIADAPNHVLTIAADLPAMRASVSSPSDTTLVIRGPSGTLRCADDTDGPNPAIDGAWTAGEYEIFVGSYARNETTPYTLTFTQP